MRVGPSGAGSRVERRPVIQMTYARGFSKVLIREQRRSGRMAKSK
jgi:hypothetical protein